MASRAHVIPNYPLVSRPSPSPSPSHRARRQVWYGNDPVVLPRSSVWRTGGGVIASALSISAIVVASAYAGYRTNPPVLAETPTAPLVDRWQLDPLVQKAHVTNLLAGPTRAVPSLGSQGPASALDAEPFMSAPASEVRSDDPASSAREHVPGVGSPDSSAIAPSAPNLAEPSAPSPDESSAPSVGEPITYPDPTSTPPDAIAPPGTTPQAPTPVLDPENPYRDRD